MYVLRQPLRESADEMGGATVGKQMKIVDEYAALALAAEHMAEIVDKHAAADRIHRAGVVTQQIYSGMKKRLLHAPPEYGEVIRVNAYANDRRSVIFFFFEIPVCRGGLAVAHRCNDSREGAVRYRSQTLLQPLGYINCIKAVFSLRHSCFSFTVMVDNSFLPFIIYYFKDNCNTAREI